MKIPSLLSSLLNAEFNTTRLNDKNVEKVYFCVNCGGDTLSRREVGANHEGHRMFRAMKNSLHYSYLKDDILSLGLDVTGVCVYYINSTDVYFPKSRTRKYNHMKGCFGCCRSCETPVKNPAVYRYCSIMCKLECCDGEERFGDVEMMVREHENSGVRRRSPARVLNNRKRKRKVEEMGRGSDGGRSALKIELGGNTVILNKGKKGEAVNLSYRKRGRKGIPHRAPLF